ncbi:hypothetical protein DL768_007582 [Monosporascus sp. mg162]|nr:hypothetical protein DL768_007582 [Monosporascus sp. mg162]
MAPTFYIFRHVEGAHELSGEGRICGDPDLSDAGRQRCAKLHNKLLWMDKVSQLVSSPIQRALGSCLLIFEPVISRGKRTIALPELTDAGTREASFGSSKSVLADNLDDKVDLGSPPVSWDNPDPEGEFGCSPEERLEHRQTVVRVLLWGHEAALLSDVHVVMMNRRLLVQFLAEEFDAPAFGAVVTWGSSGVLPIPVRPPSRKDDVRFFETRESHLRESLLTQPRR